MRKLPLFLKKFRGTRSKTTARAAVVAPRRWFVAVIVSSLSLLAGIGLLVYAIDPFQVYRKPTWYKPVFIEPYSSIPGIIRHYNYDSIVLGSSMCQNFRLSTIQKFLGWKCINATPSGCTPASAKSFLVIASERQSLQHVLYGLDISGYTKGAKAHRVSLPNHLYDKNPWNDYRYLWNQSVISEYIPTVLKAMAGRKRNRLKQDEDRMWAWDFENGHRRYGAETVIAAEKKHGGALKGGKLKEEVLEQMGDSLEINLLSQIHKNRDTKFVVFFPPYSIQAWYNIKSCGNLDAYLEFKKMAIERLLSCPNVRIYDFQAERDIICDFNNYKDSTHYSPAISRLIIERIAKGENRVLKKDISGVNLRLNQTLEEYEKAGPIVP
jgi:hypothetical protein